MWGVMRLKVGGDELVYGEGKGDGVKEVMLTG